MTSPDVLHSGELYLPLDPSITVEQTKCLELLYDYNATCPSAVVAAGNPCRVLRPVGERDREIYFRDRKIPTAILG